MRGLPLVAAFLLARLLAIDALCADAPPPDALHSPHHHHSVRILESALPGSDPDEGFFTIAVCKGRRYLARYPTEGYLIDAFWSPNGKYVAVDNRRANSGDYLWVFRLSDGYTLRMPVDAPTGHSEDAYGKYTRDLVRRVTRRFPELTSEGFDKLFTFAHGWTKSGELQVKTNLGFSNLPTQIAVVLDTYRISGTHLELIDEQVEKAPWPPKGPKTPVTQTSSLAPRAVVGLMLVRPKVGMR